MRYLESGELRTWVAIITGQGEYRAGIAPRRLLSMSAMSPDERQGHDVDADTSLPYEVEGVPQGTVQTLGKLNALVNSDGVAKEVAYMDFPLH